MYTVSSVPLVGSHSDVERPVEAVPQSWLCSEFHIEMVNLSSLPFTRGVENVMKKTDTGLECPVSCSSFEKEMHCMS